MAPVTATPIVALDVPDTRAALSLVDRLGDSCTFYKIGSQLFTAGGPRAVQSILRRGARVFLDLKYHDIPNTVLGSARAAAELGVSLLTVHATGGAQMVGRAVEAVRGTPCRVLAVTVLTSMASEALAVVWGRDRLTTPDEVIRLGSLAVDAGAHGLVCGGSEVRVLRAALGREVDLLVPGIRLAGDAAEDQARVVTPREAAEAGATYVILGRTVTAAVDPAAAMRRAIGELADAAPR
jgi:orotidine-5'-phosphate decarboxylase